MKLPRPIIVVNAQAIPANTAAVYIGRKMPGRAASPLGNPFRISSESERPEALAKYREWLEEQMASDTPARREIERIVSLVTIPTVEGALALVCWCKQPDREVACHGDAVKEMVERHIEAMR